MRVLVIAAHMDDEVLGPGATVAKHHQQGDTVICAIVTKRAYEHQFIPEEIEREKRASRAAADILGYREVRFLDLRDELLDDRLLDVIIPLEQVVSDVRPDVVYTHHRGDLNQDHRAVFQASMIACRSLSASPVRRLLSYETPSSTEQMPYLPETAFLPTYWSLVSEDALALKKEALGCFERELRDFPHPRSLQGIEILARKRGIEVGAPAAEAFVVLRDVWPEK